MKEKQPTRPRQVRDLGSCLYTTFVVLLSSAAGAYLLYLFVSVVFLGASSACPQNSCQ
jgi:hypothetical protein